MLVVPEGKVQYATVESPAATVQTNVKRGMSSVVGEDGANHRFAVPDRPKFNEAVKTLWQTTPETFHFDRDLSAPFSIDVNAWNATTHNLTARTWQYHTVDAMPQPVRDVFDALRLLDN